MKKQVALLLVLVIVFAGVLEWGYASYLAPGPAEKGTVVVIESGTGLRGVAAALKRAGAIDREDVFFAGVCLSGLAGKLKAGEYAFPAHASKRDIALKLAAGKSIEHKVTIAEGLTSRMAYDIVKAAPTLSGTIGAVPDEGTLLPETYLFRRGTTRDAIIGEMQKAQKKLLDALWPKRAKNLPFKSRRQALILASIVEKESAIPAERRRIAAVFVNRLRIGMRLQSDPTIIYGITGGHPLGRGIMKNEIEKATPYNTYAFAGLPPGPICNPGKDSIAAVLNPANNKDLYFVADGSGGHAFAETLNEQARNVTLWRRIERTRKAAGK
jgi:UPF0755 protein